MNKEIQHKKSRLFWFMGLMVFVFVLIIIVCTRIWASIELRRTTHQHAIPVVNIVVARREPSVRVMLLPGTVRAWHEASIYARSNGYLKQWYVDIGDKVQAGDVLAEIDAPELDAQLRQAYADLNVMQVKKKLAKSTADRWVDLVKKEFVSKQATEEKVDEAEGATASVIASLANHKRLEELVNFKRITAPFSGIITHRATDIGDLIHAGNTSNAKPLFRIAQSSPLRVYVTIPQNEMSNMTPEMLVTVRFSQYPGRLFKAKLLETAHAIDSKTQTLLAEFVLDNSKGELLPGQYAQVYFESRSLTGAIRLPINTLLFRKQGVYVAQVDASNHVQLTPVTIHRDFGTHVEIESGLSAGMRVILNPSDAIQTGDVVKVSLR